MAGTKEQGSFREIVSPFLKSKIEVLKKAMVLIVKNILQLLHNI